MHVLTPTDFCHAWAIFGPMVDKNTRKGGVSRAPSQQHVRFEFHHNQVSASEEFSGLFSHVFMPPPLGAGGIMFSGCPSVHRPSEA